MGFRGGARDPDLPMCPKISRGGCAGLLLIILGVSDVIANIILWSAISNGSHDDAVDLARDDIKGWSPRCSVVDVAILGLLRGSGVFLAITCGCYCSYSHRDAAAAGSVSLRTPRVSVPLAAKIVALGLGLAFGAAIAKFAASLTTGECTSGSHASLTTSPWLSHKQRLSLSN